MNRVLLIMTAALLAGRCLAADATLKIVTTTADLAAIARAVAGEDAEVRAICNGTEDPHFLQAKPGYILMARNANLWIRIGLELEIGWEKPILDGSRNGLIRPGSPGHLDASANVLKREIPAERVTRDMGDVHPSGNPHYWLDPWNGRVVAGDIAERLAVLFPDKAALFRGNAQRFQAALDERMFGAGLVKEIGADTLWKASLDGTLARFLADSGKAGSLGGWLGALKPLNGAKVVTYHRSWLYFANRFGLDILAEIEPKPGVPPTAAHLSELAASMKAARAGLILQEPFFSRKAADRLAGQTGAKVVVTANSVGGEEAASDYLALFDLIVKRLQP